MKKGLTILLLFHSFAHFAQHSVSQQQPSTLEYYEYYQQGLYGEVVRTLEALPSLDPTQEIVLHLSAKKEGKANGNAFREWIRSYPDHPMQSAARFHYSEDAFYQGDTVECASYLSKVRPAELVEDDQAVYYFISGVLSSSKGQFKRAKAAFQRAQQRGFDDKSQLTYFQSLAAYHLNESDQALDGFKTIGDHPEYGIASSYYRAKIYLDQGAYDEVTALATRELSEEKSNVNSGFYQLMGEAYARQNELAKADAYFEKAIETYPGRPSSALYYQAGVSKFKIGNEEKALSFLTESGIGEGAFARLSAFQLGRLHIRRNEPEKALAAYVEASASTDPELREESLYQAAKLNARLERYAEAISYCQDYQEEFPQGTWVAELDDLLAQAYLKTSDYDKAITLLEATPLSNQVQRSVYQKVTYQKALLLFNDGKFDEAGLLFEKSMGHPESATVANLSTFYLGEIYLRKERYAAAKAAYSRMSSRSPEAEYGLGYAAFNQQDYAGAIPYFRSAIASETWQVKQDARLRLADCLYAVKSYAEASRIYRRLDPSDYVSFQQGMIARNLDSNEEALQFLGQIGATSAFKDEALFYQGLIAFESADFQLAESGFTTLINQFDASPYLPRAYLNRGISRNNLGSLELAKQDFDFVISNYLQREEAFSAILGLQDLQQKGVAVGDLDASIREYKQANPGDNSLEVVEFEAAKSAYFDQDYSRAIQKIGAFKEAYPGSKYAAEAAYYLGDAHYRLDSLNAAREVFEDQRFLRNRYTGRVLYRLGAINYELGDFAAGIYAYRLLKSLNLSPKDNYNALDGLMTTHFANGDFAEASGFADQILNADWKPIFAERRSKLVKAKSLLALDQTEMGIQLLDELAVQEDRIAAEAAFLSAELAYTRGEYDTSLEQLFDLTARFGSYTDWVEQAYLLIAENYIGKDELFQAKATLRSIIQHSQDEQVRNLATVRLAAIEVTTDADTLKTQNDE